jgi:DNA-binding transcriptional regulator YiaG
MTTRKAPAPAEIRKAREAASLTQEAAAEKIYKSRRAWENWEGGVRPLDPALFELFLIKTGQLEKL